jgi:hypothetical protein
VRDDDHQAYLDEQANLRLDDEFLFGWRTNLRRVVSRERFAEIEAAAHNPEQLLTLMMEFFGTDLHEASEKRKAQTEAASAKRHELSSTARAIVADVINRNSSGAIGVKALAKKCNAKLAADERIVAEAHAEQRSIPRIGVPRLSRLLRMKEWRGWPEAPLS